MRLDSFTPYGLTVDELPVSRGAWLPVDAAAELFRIDAVTIRRWSGEGLIESRTVEGIEFVRLEQLRSTAAQHASTPETSHSAAVGEEA